MGRLHTYCLLIGQALGFTAGCSKTWFLAVLRGYADQIKITQIGRSQLDSPE